MLLCRALTKMVGGEPSHVVCGGSMPVCCAASIASCVLFCGSMGSGSLADAVACGAAADADAFVGSM